MKQSEIMETLKTVEEYLKSLPKDYYACSLSKQSEKEYRHGRKRKIWIISIKLVRGVMV